MEKKKSFNISATVELICERIVECKDMDEADEIADAMGGDEWAEYTVSESISDIDVVEER